MTETRTTRGTVEGAPVSPSGSSDANHNLSSSKFVAVIKGDAVRPDFLRRHSPLPPQHHRVNVHPEAEGAPEPEGDLTEEEEELEEEEEDASSLETDLYSLARQRIKLEREREKNKFCPMCNTIIQLHSLGWSETLAGHPS